MDHSTAILTKISLLFCLLYFPGPIDTRKDDIWSGQKDITTPITTLPTVIPTTTPTLTPTSSSPILNPTSNPDSASPMTMTPMTVVPATTTGPGSAVGGGSWCVASQSASKSALQVGLDYACGIGGADCAAIQPGGGCYNPNTIHAHASYAYNSYFKKNPLPSSCNFGGTAVTTNIDPSSGTCRYQSTSTTSSVLNTTNSNGSNVFGAVPYHSTPSSATGIRLKSSGEPFFAVATCFVLQQLLGRYYQ